MAQRLVRRAEDLDVPGSSPTQDNLFNHVHVSSLINWGLKPHQNLPSKSRTRINFAWSLLCFFIFQNVLESDLRNNRLLDDVIRIFTSSRFDVFLQKLSFTDSLFVLYILISNVSSFLRMFLLLNLSSL